MPIQGGPPRTPKTHPHAERSLTAAMSAANHPLLEAHNCCPASQRPGHKQHCGAVLQRASPPWRGEQRAKRSKLSSRGSDLGSAAQPTACGVVASALGAARPEESARPGPPGRHDPAGFRLCCLGRNRQQRSAYPRSFFFESVRRQAFPVASLLLHQRTELVILAWPVGANRHQPPRCARVICR